ncbi:unnamed protein product, partial [marine sediment metagenome]
MTEKARYQQKDKVIIRILQKYKDKNKNDIVKLGLRFSQDLKHALNLEPDEEFKPKRIKDGGSIILLKEDPSVQNTKHVGNIKFKSINKERFCTDFPIFFSLGAEDIRISFEKDEMEQTTVEEIKEWLKFFGDDFKVEYDINKKEKGITINYKIDDNYRSPIQILNKLINMLDTVKDLFDVAISEGYDVKNQDNNENVYLIRKRNEIFSKIRYLEEIFDKYYLTGLNRISKPLLNFQNSGVFDEGSGLNNSCEGITFIRLFESIELVIDEFKDLAMKFSQSEEIDEGLIDIKTSLIEQISEDQVLQFKFQKYYNELKNLLNSTIILIKELYKN